MWDLLLLIALGFLVGIIASMVGVGGGIFVVPVLALLYGFVTNQATATSLFAIIFTAIASTINYAKQKRIYYATGLVLAITTVPGAYFGAWVASTIEERLLGLTFGFFLIIVAARMILSLRKRIDNPKNAVVKSDWETVKSKRMILMGVGLGFFGGLASGLLGIGGGTLIVPIMMYALSMPIHLATATSMFTMIFTSISGSVQYYQQSLINFTVALFLAAGTIFGAQVGAYTSKKVSARNLGILFAVILILAGINMLWKYR